MAETNRTFTDDLRPYLATANNTDGPSIQMKPRGKMAFSKPRPRADRYIRMADLFCEFQH